MKKLKIFCFVLVLFSQVYSPLYADYYITEAQLMELKKELNGLKKENETLQMDLMTQQILAEQLKMELEKCKTEQQKAETELKKLTEYSNKLNSKNFGENMIYISSGCIIGIVATIIVEISIIQKIKK